MSEHEDQRAQERHEERQRDGREMAEATPAETSDGEGGQVSEVQSLEGAGEPIADSQSVAGSPDPDVDEGPTGPNSRAGSDKN